MSEDLQAQCVAPTATAQTGTTTVVFVRHTEVENREQVLYGRLPRFRLTPAGLAHAERIADFLSDWPIEAVYSSPLLRARLVAERIASRYPTVTRHRSALLHEVGSSWQGTPFKEFRAGFSTYQERKHSDDETIEQIRDRMLAFVRRAHRRHPGGCVVAVSHGDPITILRVALSGKPLTVGAMRGADYAALGSLTRVIVGADSCVSMDVLPTP
jgi:broad specificity phosphatase PhoE